MIVIIFSCINTNWSKIGILFNCARDSVVNTSEVRLSIQTLPDEEEVQTIKAIDVQVKPSQATAESEDDTNKADGGKEDTLAEKDFVLESLGEKNDEHTEDTNDDVDFKRESVDGINEDKSEEENTVLSVEEMWNTFRQNNTYYDDIFKSFTVCKS